MKLGTREKILLAVVGLLIYGFVFYKFIWLNTVPDIEKKTTELKQVKSTLAGLEADLKGIDQKKDELNTKKVNNEKLNQYLMSNANIVDSVEYIQKLSKLLGKGITKATIDAPVELISDANSKYYEFKIDFEADLEYQESIDMIRFIEDGDRKIRISEYTYTPVNVLQKNNALPNKDVNPAVQSELKYHVGMTVNLYSLSMSNADKLYEYSRHKFSDYLDNEGVPFQPSNTKAKIKSSGVVYNDSIKSKGVYDAQIALLGKSFLYPDDNIQIYGTARPSEVFTMRALKKKTVNIDIQQSNYTIDTETDSGKPVRVSGRLTDDDYLKMYVEADFKSSIDANKELGFDIKISNSSNKKIYLTLVNNESKAYIMDRTGSLIGAVSKMENLTVV